MEEKDYLDPLWIDFCKNFSDPLEILSGRSRSSGEERNSFEEYNKYLLLL